MKKFILRFALAVFAFGVFCLSIDAQNRGGETFAITGARVVTVSGAPIENGTIIIRDGLIESVGAAGSVKVPADARSINGAGLTVYPGFFDALSTLGLQAAPPPPQARGQGQPSQAAQTNQSPSNANYPDGLQPEQTVFDALKAGDAQFEIVRNAGFTTALTVPREGIFNGQSAIINLAGDAVSAMIIKSPAAEHITFTTLRSGAFPTSLMGTFAALRQMFLDAQRLQAVRKQYEKDPRGIRRPGEDKSLDALLPILNREMPVVLNANTEVEIDRALNLAKEFNLNAIIAGGQEAWKAADRLKAQNVPVLLSLNFPKRTAVNAPEADPEPLELLRLRAETPKTAARLAQAGVKFAFQSGGMQNIADFLTNANKSVENGLTRDAAIRAMTLSAAEIFGVDNRLGSIERGKIANLVVSRGDIFNKDKQITQVFVDGRLFEQKERPKTPPSAAAKAAAGAETSANALAQVGGNYTITIEIPGQPLPATLNLTQQEAVLSGNFQSQLGTVPIKDGKVTAEGFTFTANVEFSGQQVELVVNGRVAGNQISGTMNSPMGAVPFSGTKTP